MDRIITLAGKSFAFSTTAAGDMNKLKEKDTKLWEEIGQEPSGNEVNQLSSQISAFRNFFDAMFGDGSADQLSAKGDLYEYMQAYADFAEQITAQGKENEQALNRLKDNELLN